MHCLSGFSRFLAIAAMQSSPTLATDTADGHGIEAAATGPQASTAATRKAAIRRNTGYLCLLAKMMSHDFVAIRNDNVNAVLATTARKSRSICAGL
jgi:hypothetical protein